MIPGNGFIVSTLLGILCFSHWSELLQFAMLMQFANADLMVVIVSPVRSTYRGYYGLVVVTPRPPRPRPRPQTLHRSHDNLKNPYRIASIFYM